MAEYERHAAELVEAMRERHASEIKEFQRTLLQRQQRPKFSRELLNLRRIQEHLAKQKDYTECCPCAAPTLDGLQQQTPFCGTLRLTRSS